MDEWELSGDRGDPHLDWLTYQPQGLEGLELPMKKCPSVPCFVELASCTEMLSSFNYTKETCVLCLDLLISLHQSQSPSRQPYTDNFGEWQKSRKEQNQRMWHWVPGKRRAILTKRLREVLSEEVMKWGSQAWTRQRGQQRQTPGKRSKTGSWGAE